MDGSDDHGDHIGKPGIMRSKPAQLVMLLSGFLALAGCGTRIPNCDDQETIEDVKSLVEDHYDDDPAVAAAGSVVAEISDVRTIEQTKSKERKCTAKAMLIPPDHAPKSLTNREDVIAFRITPAKDGLSYSIVVDWP